MPEFTITRTYYERVRCWRQLRIEADSEDAAKDKFVELEDSGDLQWDAQDDDIKSVDYETTWFGDEEWDPYADEEAESNG